MVTKFLSCILILSACMIINLPAAMAADPDPVCDPSISTMLNNAGKAQARADIAQIDAIITPPTNVHIVGCVDDIRGAAAGAETNITCTGPQAVWDAAKKAADCATATGADRPADCPAVTGEATGGGTTTGSNGGKFDTIDLMLASTAPVSTLDDKCHPGIPTGVKINGANEIVCPNPGCYPDYDKDNNVYKCKAY